jgi:hypothetical protein
MGLRKKGRAISASTTWNRSTPNIVIVPIPDSIIAPVDIAAEPPDPLMELVKALTALPGAARQKRKSPPVVPPGESRYMK